MDWGMLPMWNRRRALRFGGRECCQCGNVANVEMLPVSNANVANSSKGIGNWKLGLATLAILATFLSAHAENAYTNHAGNVVSGWPVALTATHVTLGERTPDSRVSTTNSQLTTTNSQLLTITYPLSIFPTNEQRRIAADFGQPHVPVAVKRAIAGAEKAMARSRKRAEMGLCTQEESDAFCKKSESALKTYLDKQVKEGVITPAECKALGH